jgi:hypothetical protein
MGAHIKLICLAACSVLISLPAHAHHSFGQFDDKKCSVIEGIIKKFEFSYPHTWLWITAKGADGADVVWGFEGADPATLSLYGWSQDFMKKGEKITVAFNPLRDGRNGGSMRKITLPSGKTVSAQGDESVFAKCDLAQPTAAK